jgi:hypothetical protein
MFLTKFNVSILFFQCYSMFHNVFLRKIFLKRLFAKGHLSGGFQDSKKKHTQKGGVEGEDWKVKHNETCFNQDSENQGM